MPLFPLEEKDAVLIPVELMGTVCAGAYLLYGFMAFVSDSDGRCNATDAVLADGIGLRCEQVPLLLKELSRKGLILEWLPFSRFKVRKPAEARMVQ